jgi:hypothetical protein
MDFKRQTSLILIKLVAKIRLEPPLQLLLQIKIAIPLKVSQKITHSEIENNNVVLGCCCFLLPLLAYLLDMLGDYKKSNLRSYQKKSIPNLPPIPQNETPTKSLEIRPGFVSSCKMFHFTRI